MSDEQHKALVARLADDIAATFAEINRVDPLDAIREMAESVTGRPCETSYDADDPRVINVLVKPRPDVVFITVKVE